jgi:hypothetical protein
LTIWLDKDMQWYAPASGKRGRQRVFSEAAIQFCLSIKCLFNLALRQSLGLVESLLRLAGLDWSVPDNSPVCRRQKTLRVQLPYRASTTALDLLVDSTGIKFLGEGECKRKKHGAEYRRQWRKVHLGIDAQTLEIRVIEVTDNSVGDAPMLPELLAQIPPDEAVASVSGDGAYDTKACHAAIVQRGAQAGIPPRKNGKPCKTTLVGAIVRNEALKACHRLGYTIWKKCSGYHRRSLVDDQDALLQATGRAGHGTHVRASSGGVACACGAAQPLHAARAPDNGSRARHGIASSGVGVISFRFRLVQQSLAELQHPTAPFGLDVVANALGRAVQAEPLALRVQLAYLLGQQRLPPLAERTDGKAQQAAGLRGHRVAVVAARVQAGLCKKPASLALQHHHSPLQAQPGQLRLARQQQESKTQRVTGTKQLHLTDLRLAVRQCSG